MKLRLFIVMFLDGLGMMVTCTGTVPLKLPIPVTITVTDSPATPLAFSRLLV